MPISTIALDGLSSILFVGNSYTFGRVDPVMSYNTAEVRDLTAPSNGGTFANTTGSNPYEPHPWGGVPGIFNMFADQAGLNLDVAISARNAATLQGHYLNSNPAGWDLRGNIAGQKWDTVVLQDNSTQALPSGAGSVTFAAGSSTATVTITPTGDTKIETDETLGVTLAAGAAYTVGTSSTLTGTILNDDPTGPTNNPALPTVTLAASPAAVLEDSTGILTYTFTRTGSTASALTINFTAFRDGSTSPSVATSGASQDFEVWAGLSSIYKFESNGAATSGAVSFTSNTGSITIAAGATTATLKLDPKADATVETDEGIRFTLSANANYNVGTQGPVQITILNDDYASAPTLPVITATLSKTAIYENGGENLVYEFSRTGSNAQALTVNFGVNGTATLPGNDFTVTGASSFTTGGASDPNLTSFQTYAAKLAQYIKTGAADGAVPANANANSATEVFLYETWARPNLVTGAVVANTDPTTGAITNTGVTAPEYYASLENMTADLRSAYEGLAASNPIFSGVAPVGAAFLAAVVNGTAIRNPYTTTAGSTVGNIDLWWDDNLHASKYGSYLSALTLFGTITGLDPRSLGAGEKAASDLGISATVAGALQNVAAATLAFSGSASWTAPTKVTELTTASAGTLASAGAFNFSDSDTTHTHTVTVAPVGTGNLGTMIAVLRSDSTGDGTGGAVNWTYAVDDSLVESLNAGETKVEHFLVTITDNQGGTASRDIAVTITGTGDAPVITSNGGGATGTVSIFEGRTAITTVTATDVDTTSVLTYSITGGADAALFQIDATTGALSFINQPRFSAPADQGADNVYDVVVQVSDGTNIDTQALAVTVTADTTPPTLTITSSASALKFGQTAVITFTFSEDPGATFTWDGTSGDIAVTGGTLSAISGTGLTRTATFTPTAGTNGSTASITVAAGAYTDFAGNAGGAGATPLLTFDTARPTVLSLVANGASPTNAASVTYTLTFSEAVTGVVASDFALTGAGASGASVSSIVSPDGITYTVTITTGSDGTLGVTFDPRHALDMAGNNIAGGAFVSGGAVALDSSLGFNGFYQRSVAIGDVNGDGKADVVEVSNFGYLSTALGNGDGTFAAATNAFVGGQDAYVVLADLNGDGKADVVTENFNGNALAVLLSNGDGTYAAPQRLHVDGTGSPATFAVGDITGDGKTDIVELDGQGNLVTFVGVGDGTFYAADIVNFNLHGALAIGDINGDGRNDIAQVDTTNGAIFTMTTNASGTITSYFNVTGFTSPVSLAVGDVNGDGHADLVTSNSDGYVTIQTLTGAAVVGSSNSYSSGFAGAGQVRLGDFNGDGKTDILVATGTGVSLLAGNGDGTFGTATTFSATLGAIAVGDFDGDGRIDLVSTGADFSFQAPILLNLPSAVTNATVTVDKTPPTLAITSSVAALKFGETATITFTFSEDPGATFAWDGTSGDVVVTGGTLSAISGTGLTRTATFTPTANTDGGTASITVAAGTYTDAATNLGGAGTTPSLTFDTVRPTVSSLVANGATPTNADSVTYTLTFSEAVTGVVASDFALTGAGASGASITSVTSSDGISYTITIATGSDGALGVSFDPRHVLDAGGNNVAGGTFVSGGAVALDSSLGFNGFYQRSVALGDVNGDGKLDVVGVSNFGYLSTALGNGDGTFAAATSTSVGGQDNYVALADLNGDGKADIVTENLNGNALAVLLSNGDGSFGDPIRLHIDGTSAPARVAVGDISGDGKPDLVELDSSNHVVTFVNDGTGAFAAIGFASVPSISSLAVADVDGDGRADIVLSTADGNSVMVLATDSSGSITYGRTTNGFAGIAAKVAVGDLNVDSKLDIVASNTNGSITIALGEGSGYFTIGATYSTGLTSAGQVQIGDFNGDGKTDILVAGATGVSLLAGNGDGTFGTATTYAATLGAIALGDINGDGRIDVVSTGVDFSFQAPILLDVPPVTTSGTLTIDKTPPTLAITSNVAALKIGETAVITFTFSEDPGSTFTWDGSAGDVVVTGGTLSAISGTGLTRTATFTPTAGTNGGTASITVAAGTYTDTAGNGGGAGTTPSLTFDTLAPTLAITSNVSQLKAGATATITFTFSEDPGNTFTWDGSAGDVVVSGGTLSAISGSGLTRTATFTPTANTNAGTASVMVAASTYADAAGNGGGAGTTPSLTFDTKPPTLAITSNVSQLKIGETATITFTFSEDPSGSFTDSDIVVTGGTLSAISGSGLTRTATFTPTANTDATIASITVAAGAYTDAAGNNGGAGTTPSLVFDTKLPTTTSIVRVGTALNNATSEQFTVTFSESVTGVDETDFVLTTSGTAAGTISSVTGTGTTRTVTVTGVTGDGTLRLDLKASGTGIADGTGNAISGGFTAGQTYTIDHIAPKVTAIADTPASGTRTTRETVTLRLATSEPVTVTGAPTLTLSNGATAIYSAAASTSTSLAFVYTVGSHDTASSALKATAVNLPSGVTIRDAAGNDANVSLTGLTQTGPVIAPVNAVPVATATIVQSLHVASTVAASSLFTASDADGDAITRYRFVDATTGAGSFFIGGVPQAAFTFIEISSAQLAQTTFTVASSRGAYDSLYVAAYDGQDWGSYTQFYVIGTNAAPTVTAPSNTNVAKFSNTPLSSLLTVSDPDGDLIPSYQFYDATAATDSGSILLNGVAQAAGSVITATASQLASAQLAFQAGSGADDLLVRVYDGSDFSAWTSFRITAPINRAPVTTATAAVQSLHMGRTVAASTLFSTTDADSDAITRYRLYDATAGNGSFSVNGVVQSANTVIDISVAQLAQTTFTVATPRAAYDQVYVSAYDGIAWSAYTPFYVMATNTAPAVTAPANTNVAKLSTTPLSNLLTTSDPDGDALTIYQFYDANAAADSGSILLNGVTQAAGTIVTATASQVTSGQAAFRAGSGADDLLVRVYDGSDFSAWAQFRVTAPVNHAPVTSATSPQSLQSGASVPVSSLFSVTDSDADPITAYQFFDATPGNGSFSIGGTAQAANMLIDVSSSQLAQTAFTPGAAGAGDTLYVRAYDGLAWSGFSQFTATSHA